MRKLLISLMAGIALVVGPGLLLAGQAGAVEVFEPCSTGAGSSSVCTDVSNQGDSNTNPVITVIKVVIQLLAIIIGVTAVIIIIVSGLRMVTASGDAQAITNARNGIVYALVGLVVALAAQAFVSFVLSKIQ